MMILAQRFLVVLVALVAWASTCRADVRIKDITQVEGARSNPLYGLGLVVGLNNTGARALSTQQMAIDMLRKMDVTTKIARQSLLDNVFKSNNIAAVMVTTELPEFGRKGSRLDVVVSVLDDATSLEGGTLLLTPLKGADGEVHAVAQGQVSIGGFRVRNGGGGGQLNHPTVGKLQGGAIIEREALGEINQNGVIRLLLREPDYSTASIITKAINAKFAVSAKTVDAGTIQVRVPAQHTSSVPEFVGEIGLLAATPDAPARVVINERTGTIIVGHQVRVSAVAIAHGNLVIKPTTAVVPPSVLGDLSVNGLPPGPLMPLPGPPPLLSPPAPSDDPTEAPRLNGRPPTSDSNGTTYTVAELARILNALGASPRDLIAIFQALKQSGALHAELIVM